MEDFHHILAQQILFVKFVDIRNFVKIEFYRRIRIQQVGTVDADCKRACNHVHVHACSISSNEKRQYSFEDVANE